MSFSRTFNTSTGRERLLLVEDDLTSVFALRHFFAFAGYDVDCAAGPSEGLRLLDRHQYDAIITDLHLMPERQGEGIAVAMHARLCNPHACVVLLTANGSGDTEAEARRCGVDIYQTKPVDLRDLRDGIARVLSHHRMAGIARPGDAGSARSGEGM